MIIDDNGLECKSKWKSNWTWYTATIFGGYGGQMEVY